MTEAQLHTQIVGFLNVALAGNAFCFHIPMGGKRPRGEAGKLKGMGAVAGMPDLCIADGGRSVWLEIKTETGRLSPDQVACHARLARAGHSVVVVRSLDETVVALKRLCVPLRDVRL